MENSKRNTERRGSFRVITLIIVIIIVIVVAGIFVALLLNSKVTKITLFTLLILLVLLAVGSCLFIELQRKRALRKRDRSAQLWVQYTLDEQRRTTAQVNGRTSWALSAPWKNDHPRVAPDSECSLPPYSPPFSSN